MVNRVGLLLVCLLLGAGVARGEDAKESPWTGDWSTSFTPLTLKQDGDKVTGSYGNSGQFSVEGTVSGDKVSFTWREGTMSNSGEWVMQEGGRHFKGKLTMANGRPRDWHGWQKDPAATKGKGKYKGLWLTNLGLMELKPKGKTASGRFALRGGSTIDGDLKGRRYEFLYKVFRGGQGWFEMAKDNASFRGVGSDAGSGSWWAWNGRKAPEYKRHVKLKAGKQLAGSTESLLTYQVRAPDSYKPGKKFPCILILHGSNMNSDAYVNTLAVSFPALAKDYIILGINGERPSHIGSYTPKGTKPAKGSFPSFNYTYVNFVGKSTFKGYPGTDRESPALVSEAMGELEKVYPISKWFVGGHSQGGYLTYSLLMNYPDQIAGAFPIAGGVIFQCEPSAYDNAKVMAAQRATPLAIVHAKNDPVVGYGMSRYAAEMYGEQGWQAFRFFNPGSGQHMFAHMPLGEVIPWLEVMSSDDVASIQDFAAKKIREKAWPDATSALRRAMAVEGKAPSERTKQLLGMIDSEAQEDAQKYEKLVRENKDASWIDDFLAFRDKFQHARCAEKAMAAFGKLRAKHKKPADEAYQAARQAFRNRDQDGGYAKYQEIVDQHYASARYRTIKRWISERK